MQFIKLLATAALAAFVLTACEGTMQGKEETAAVEERSTTGTSTGAQTNGTGGETQAVPGSRMSEPNLLTDPDSLLSERIIYFDYDSAEVRDDDLSIIEAHARYLLRTPSAGILFEGHADERGSREYNVALGERRALAVTQIMQLLGVPSAQIRTVSYGEERPAIDGADDSSLQQNRRVELAY